MAAGNSNTSEHGLIIIFCHLVLHLVENVFGYLVIWETLYKDIFACRNNHNYNKLLHLLDECWQWRIELLTRIKKVFVAYLLNDVNVSYNRPFSSLTWSILIVLMIHSKMSQCSQLPEVYFEKSLSSVKVDLRKLFFQFRVSENNP
jgi:hypothetical protein